MKRRYFPIAVTVAACLVAALVGYSMPAAEQDAPTRVVMDNTGGRVIFSHMSHIDDYGLDCADCHHDDTGLDTYLPCGACHPTEFNEEFRTSHAKNFPSQEACLRCHDEVPEGPLAPEERPLKEDIPLRAEAFHSLCMGCHEENGGPYGSDSCNECHSR